MKYIDKRVGIICRELKRLSTKQKFPIESFEYKKGNFVYPHDVDAAKEPWETFDSKTMHWYGPDKHYWFRTTYTVPKQMHNKPLWIHVRTQINEWDDAKNPQFLLFVNGEITQGIDMNHRKVFLTSNAQEGEVYTFDLQAHTGIIHSEFQLFVDVIEVDAQIEQLYYDMDVPLSAFNRMDDMDQNKLKMTEILNDTVNLLDLRKPYSEAFYQSLTQAKQHIEKALYQELSGYEDVIATCIGHTHIDVAWWWTVEQTREKVGRSFATVLKFMEEYPDYKFMSSQPQLYEFLKVRYPDLYAKVKEKVAQGRWEPEGGMWVEADCNLTSGESLVRQFLHGKRFFKEEFGVDNKILWLPDVFGYSGALPQIMKRSGIDYFMTTKLAWNQMNQMPYDTLYWKGIDGTKIFTHLITTLGVGQDTKNFFTTYNGMLHPDAIMGGWQRYNNKELNNDILISYGYGDGGGGPTRQMLETSKRMEKGIQGIPKVRQAFSRTYFDELYNRTKEHKRLPEWEGEFYFEYHRGTYTSMARNKKSNRRCEQLLMDLELYSILAGMDYSQQLHQMWRVVLMNQFHDILPGTSIEEVYEVTKEEYNHVEAKLREYIDHCIANLVRKKENHVTVFNQLGFERDDIIHLPKVDGDCLVDEKGQRFLLQKTEDGCMAYLTHIPSKAQATYEVLQLSADEKTSIKNPFTIHERGIKTPFYEVQFNANGQIVSILDCEQKRELVQENKVANHFKLYEDKPMDYDNWDIEMYYSEKYYDITDLTMFEWTQVGPVKAVLKVEYAFSQSRLCQEIVFYSQSRRIDFNTYVDYREKQHLLKVHFPMDIHTDEATFDIQFGNLTRKTHKNTSWDQARFEVCGQKWIDISEGNYGVSLLNDCKYGHSVHGSDMGLTLLKSGILPNPNTDQEEHTFRYSLYPHTGDWKKARTVEEAYKFNQQAYAVMGEALGDQQALVTTDDANVLIETIKEAQDHEGIIIRIYEYENSRTRTKVRWNLGTLISVEECNLIEEVEQAIEHDENSFNIVIKPFEIKTYKINYRK